MRSRPILAISLVIVLIIALAPLGEFAIAAPPNTPPPIPSGDGLDDSDAPGSTNARTLLDIELHFDPADALPAEPSESEVRVVSPIRLQKIEPAMHLLAVSKDGAYAVFANVYTTYSPWPVCFHLWPEILASVLFLAWLFVGWRFTFRILLPRIRQRRAGANACQQCGYDLRASPDTACPECGAKVSGVGKVSILPRKRVMAALVLLLLCSGIVCVVLWQYPITEERPGWLAVEPRLRGGRNDRADYKEDAGRDPFRFKRNEWLRTLKAVLYLNNAELVVMRPDTGTITRFPAFLTTTPFIDSTDDEPELMCTSDAIVAATFDSLTGEVTALRMPEGTVMQKWVFNKRSHGFTVGSHRLSSSGDQLIFSDLDYGRFTTLDLATGVEKPATAMRVNGMSTIESHANVFYALSGGQWKQSSWLSDPYVSPLCFPVVMNRAAESQPGNAPARFAILSGCDDTKWALISGYFVGAGKAAASQPSDPALVMVADVDRITASTRKTAARIVARGRTPNFVVHDGLAFVWIYERGDQVKPGFRGDRLELRICDLPRWRWLPQVLTIDLSTLETPKNLPDGRPDPGMIFDIRVSEDMSTALVTCFSSKDNMYLAEFDLQAAGIVPAAAATQPK